MWRGHHFRHAMRHFGLGMHHRHHHRRWGYGRGAPCCLFFALPLFLLPLVVMAGLFLRVL